MHKTQYFPSYSPTSSRDQNGRIDHGARGHDTRSIPEGEKHYSGVHLHQRETSKPDSDDIYDDEFDYCEGPRSLDSGYSSLSTSEQSCDDDDDNDGYRPAPRLEPGRRLTRKQLNFLLANNRRDWSYYRDNAEVFDSPESYLKGVHEVGLLKPSRLTDKIKDRVCDYLENPILFVRLGCSVVLHSLMGTMLASTLLGAGMTLGISAPLVGMVAIPVLALGAIGGGVLGFHNDFVLDKSLLPKDFNWLDGFTRTTYLPKYTFPMA